METVKALVLNAFSNRLDKFMETHGCYALLQRRLNLNDEAELDYT